ncbi:MAG: hypothetical protein OIF40_03850 [Mangrovicoccus sp.]|nr:hypothetical protein [Mangrovicoccus sp.]
MISGVVRIEEFKELGFLMALIDQAARAQQHHSQMQITAAIGADIRAELLSATVFIPIPSQAFH